MAPSISIDTGVLVEFIDESGDFHSEAAVVMESIASGNLMGFVAHPVFAELYYVSSRLYEMRRRRGKEITASEEEAEQLIKWLFSLPGIVMPENSLELALEAGRIKRRFAFALTDSYVLAAAKLNQCKAVFKGPVQEMNRRSKLERLKEEVELVFLEDYSL